MQQRWQDWVELVLGVLLFIAPWVLVYSGTGIAAGSSWVLGVAIVVFAAIALGQPQVWQEWVNLVLGILVFLCPFVFGYYATLLAAAWTQWVLGVLTVIAAIWALAEPGKGERTVGSSA